MTQSNRKFGIARLKFFRNHELARIWISSRRLPVMRLHRWQGPRAPSNTCFSWFIWDERVEQKRIFYWFDWRLIISKRE